MNRDFMMQNIFYHAEEGPPGLRGLTVSKGSVYTGSDILIMILRCETACPLQLGAT
jgi:hypothetical protein